MRKVLLAVLASFMLCSCVTMQAFQPSPPNTNPKLQFEGDSITWQSSTNNSGFCQCINDRFGATYNVAINALVGTDTYAQENNVRVEGANSPDFVIINLGTNDATELATGTIPSTEPPEENTLSQVEARYNEFFADFPSTTCVMFVTINTHNPSWGPLEAAALNAYLHDHFTHLVDWDGAYDASDYPTTDNPHPNAQGRIHLLDLEQAAITSCGA